MNSPFVEVLLATYNGEKYLPDLLMSLKNQTYQDFHIIARDDCSNDNSLVILQDFQAKYPEMISIISHNNNPIGPAENFSILLEISSAPYVMFCDQDDVWLPDKIKYSLEGIQKTEKKNLPNTPTLLHTDMTIVNADLKLISPSFFKFSKLDPNRDNFSQLLVQNIITGCTIIINRPLAELASPIPSQARMHDWWLALIASGLGVIEYLPESTLLYRQHSENTIGASQFNLNSIAKKAIDILKNFDKSILEDNFLQAKIYEKLFYPLLMSSKQETLECFMSIRELNFSSKRKMLLKHKFTKGSFIQNIGLFIGV